ncbi:hypothetical protein FQZ97_1190700 [compost metagenome]
MVVPPAVANMLVVLGKWHLDEPAQIVVKESVRRLRGINRCTGFGNVNGDGKNLMSDLGG